MILKVKGTKENVILYLASKTKQGEKKVSDFWDKLAEKVKKEGIKLGKEQNAVNYIIGMLKKGISINDIADITKKSKSFILTVKANNNL